MPTVAKLISSADVVGTAVFSRDHVRLGHIDALMIDKPSGTVVYAVLACGGFLGINERHCPLPWSSLADQTALDGYVIDLDAHALAQAPTTPLAGADIADTGWGQGGNAAAVRAEDEVPLNATDTIL